MRKTIVSIASLIAAGAGLVLAAGTARSGGTLATGESQAPQQTAPSAAGAGAPAAGAPPQASATPEQKAILEGVARFADSFGRADVESIAQAFIDDATIVDPDGNETRGKGAISEMYGASFQESPGLKLEAKVDEIRLLTQDVARVAGRSRLSSPKSDAAEFNRFNVLLVRQEGQWRIAEIREHAAAASDVKPYERLKELEWMVGDWVDESENIRSQSSVRWADNQSFLVRTFSIEVQGEKPTTGTMFVGWDPHSGQIKSWLFNSEGGHGEGLWTRTGEKEWVVKSQGVMRDGRPTSATQIHTLINKDSVKVSSIDRIIGGVVAPDIVDLIMVRKPPQPAGSAAKASAPADVPK
jgi:uncharacterized protein (TIGR02246 family)